MLRLVRFAALLAPIGVLGCGDGVDSTGTGGMMFVPGPTCIAFCAHVIGTCEAFTSDEAACRQTCERDLAEAGASSDACAQAVDAAFQCVAELDCQVVYDQRDGVIPPDEYPCQAEVEQVDSVCPAS